jgi:hypothetical protein
MMSITGVVHQVNDPTAFFLPIILGTGKPTSGYVPLKSSGVVVTMLAYFQPPLFPAPGIPFPLSANVSASNGSFTLPDIPAAILDLTKQVSITVSVHSRPYYRTELFPRTHTEKPLDIFVYQPSIPSTDGVTAGQISTGLGGGGLPGNTTLSANPWGLGVVGSKSGADIQFGIQIVPDRSTNLSVYLDLAIDGWDISVGFPADWCTSADDILNNIKSALQTSGSATNKLVSGALAKAFEGPPLNLSSTVTQKVLDNVSIQFVTMSLPKKYTWPLSNQSDKTVVVVPTLALGYPRGL